jgi:hypothetical protein
MSTVIFNESFYISEDTRVSIADEMLLGVGRNGGRREVPHENEWDDKEGFNPFDEFVATV